MGKFHCVRVYPDGSAKETWRDEAGMNNWLAANREMRPGNTLFVNGVQDSERKSGLGEDWTLRIEAALADEYARNQARAALDVIGPQTECIGLLSRQYRYYEGYRPEPDRSGFRHLKGE